MVLVIGFVILFLFSQEIDNNVVNTLDSLPAEKEVELHGIAKNVRQTDKGIFMIIYGERIEETPVVVFSPEKIFVEEGRYVEVKGTVEDYKGKKEIIASEILMK